MSLPRPACGQTGTQPPPPQDLVTTPLPPTFRLLPSPPPTSLSSSFPGSSSPGDRHPNLHTHLGPQELGALHHPQPRPHSPSLHTLPYPSSTHSPSQLTTTLLAQDLAVPDASQVGGHWAPQCVPISLSFLHCTTYCLPSSPSQRSLLLLVPVLLIHPADSKFLPKADGHSCTTQT